MFRTVVCGLVMIAALPLSAAAQDTVDAQLWAQVVVAVRLSDNWRLHLEEWPRWYENASESFQIITRTAVGRRLNPKTTVGRICVDCEAPWPRRDARASRLAAAVVHPADRRRLDTVGPPPP